MWLPYAWQVLCPAPVYMMLDDVNKQMIVSIYILAVAVTARLTDGYVYGIAASFLSVILVNYIYTYPYLQFNFTMAGILWPSYACLL